MIRRRRNCLRAAVIAVTLATYAAFPLPGWTQQAVTFGLIGDLGYSEQEEPWLQNVLDDINKHALAFIVHDGDLSSAPRACTDELLLKRIGQFNAVAHPFVLTPGDNDRTDCHDAQGVKGGNPLQRLARVREVFFQTDSSLGNRTMPLIRQSQDPAFAQFRENVRWDASGVTFITVHIPGSNNGLLPSPADNAEFKQRNAANLAWLRQGFEHAKANNGRAIMIVLQANMFDENLEKRVEHSGFEDTRALLAEKVAEFGKPVVVVHGDTHRHRLENPVPFRNFAQIPNLTRLETFGRPHHHWVEVTIVPDDPKLLKITPRQGTQGTRNDTRQPPVHPVGRAQPPGARLLRPQDDPDAEPGPAGGIGCALQRCLYQLADLRAGARGAGDRPLRQSDPILGQCHPV